MRKILTILSVGALLISFSCCDENANSAPDQKITECTTTDPSCTDRSSDFEFTVNSGEVTIDNVLAVTPEIFVPETIDGYTVTEIGDSAFYQNNCTSISLPPTIRTIRSSAFYRCYALEKILIPSATENIEGNPFYRCSSLVDIRVEEGNRNYCDVDGVLYNSEKNVLVAYPEGRTATVYDIPDGVTTICDMAFGYCSLLERVTVPESVTNFPDYNLFELYEEICLVVVPGSAAEQYATEFEIQTELFVSE